MGKTPPSPTMRSIAERAGVSRMTVSRALRNSPLLAPATRARIQALAQEMGYNRNALVTTLMAHLRARRTPRHIDTIAFVSNYTVRDAPRLRQNQAYDYLTGTAERAAQLGYRVDEVWAKEPGMTGRRLEKILLARGIRGLVLGPLERTRGHMSLNWSKFATVALGYSVWHPRLTRSSVDHHQGMILALREAKRLGYDRPGLVLPRVVNERVGWRFEAATLAHQRRMPRTDRVPPLIAEKLAEENVVRWFKTHRPDVVLGMPSYVQQWLEYAGVRFPQTAGFINLQWEEATVPCAGIYHNGRAAAAAAVDMVVARLQHHEFGLPAHVHVMMVNCEWRDGPTIRPAR